MCCLKKIFVLFFFSFVIAFFVETAFFQKNFNYLFHDQKDLIKEYTISSANFTQLSQSRKINFDNSPFICFDLNPYGYVRGIKVQINGARHSDYIRVYFSDRDTGFSDGPFVRHKIKKNKKFDYIVLNKYAKSIGFGSESLARDKNIISVTVNPSIKETVKYVSWNNILQLTLLSFLSLLFLFQRSLLLVSSEYFCSFFKVINYFKFYNFCIYNVVLFLILYLYFFYYVSVIGTNFIFSYPDSFYFVLYRLLLTLTFFRLGLIFSEKKYFIFFLSLFFVYFFNQIFLINTNTKTIFEFMLIAIACYKIPYKLVLSSYVFSVGILFIASILFMCFGLLKNIVYFDGVFFRNSLGLTYPTDGAAYLFFLSLSIYSILKRRFDFVLCIFLLLFIFIQIKYTRTRNTEILMFLTILLIIYSFIRNPEKFFCQHSFIDRSLFFILFWSFAICACLSICLSYLYSPESPFFTFIDSLLSGRLSIVRHQLDNYDITFLGNYMDLVGVSEIQGIGYNYLDSTYCQLLIRYGLFSIIMFWVLYVFTAKSAVREKNFKIFCSMALIAIHSFTEHRYIEFFINPFVLLFFSDFSLKNGNYSER